MCPQNIPAFVPYPRYFFICGISAFTLGLTGCGRTKVQSYRVPKENAASLPSAMTTAVPISATLGNGALIEPVMPLPNASATAILGPKVSKANGPVLTWKAPTEWAPKPLGAMRKGSFAIPGEGGALADLSITSFPGAVGGDLANVNRWRGQLGLIPITGAELADAVLRINANGLTINLVDLSSTDPAQARILGALVEYDGAMWFFKISGPGELVGTLKPAFVNFLQSVKVSSP